MDRKEKKNTMDGGIELSAEAAGVLASICGTGGAKAKFGVFVISPNNKVEAVYGKAEGAADLTEFPASDKAANLRAWAKFRGVCSAYGFCFGVFNFTNPEKNTSQMWLVLYSDDSWPSSPVRLAQSMKLTTTKDKFKAKYTFKYNLEFHDPSDFDQITTLSEGVYDGKEVTASYNGVNFQNGQKFDWKKFSFQ